MMPIKLKHKMSQTWGILPMESEYITHKIGAGGKRNKNEPPVRTGRFTYNSVAGGVSRNSNDTP